MRGHALASMGSRRRYPASFPPSTRHAGTKRHAARSRNGPLLFYVELLQNKPLKLGHCRGENARECLSGHHAAAAASGYSRMAD